MKVWYCNCTKNYNACLSKGLLETDGIDLELLDPSLFINKLSEFILSTGGNKEQLKVVIDISCETILTKAVQILRKNVGAVLSSLTFVIISTFSTWGGDSYASGIDDLSTVFRCRTPIASSFDEYCLENILLESANNCNANMCIIPLGLMYGDKGFDLHIPFMNIWNSIPQKLFCSESNTAPLIHYKAFVGTVCEVVQASDPLPTVVPAAEFAVSPLFNILSDIDEKLNGKRSIAFSSAEDRSNIANESCSNPLLSLWSCDLAFLSARPSSGNDAPPAAKTLQQNHMEAWHEFLDNNSLRPMAVLVTGYPISGKTKVTQRMAESLELQRVSLLTAMKALARTTNEMYEINGGVGALELIRTAKEELVALVELKASEGKKPAKGAAPAPVTAEDGTIDEELLTETFCGSVPAELGRKCISAQIELDSLCQRRGFVLDVWDPRIVDSVDSLSECLNWLSAAGGDRSNEKKFIQTVVELQCQSTLPMERLMESFGANAKSKESQTIIKAVEASVNAYSQSLRPLKVEGGDSSAQLEDGGNLSYTCMSHPGVIDLEQQASASGIHNLVCRIDSSVGEEDDIVLRSVDFVLAQRRYDVGWLPQLSSERKAVNRVAELQESSGLGATSIPQATASIGIGSICAPVDTKDESVSDILLVESSFISEVSQLDDTKKLLLSAKSDKLLSFLNAILLPQVTSGMVRILRERPEDPIVFLADLLLEHSVDKTKSAHDKARLRFLELLHQGQ